MHGFFFFLQGSDVDYDFGFFLDNDYDFGYTEYILQIYPTPDSLCTCRFHSLTCYGRQEERRSKLNK